MRPLFVLLPPETDRTSFATTRRDSGLRRYRSPLIVLQTVGSRSAAGMSERPIIPEPLQRESVHVSLNTQSPNAQD